MGPSHVSVISRGRCDLAKWAGISQLCTDFIMSLRVPCGGLLSIICVCINHTLIGQWHNLFYVIGCLAEKK